MGGAKIIFVYIVYLLVGSHFINVHMYGIYLSF